jgi:hypothetical protein
MASTRTCGLAGHQIARILNRQGHRSGRGLAFTQSSVTLLRFKNHIPKCPAPVPRDDREGPFTADEAARELGVSMHALHCWLRDGILVGQQATPRAPWRILLTGRRPPSPRRWRHAA